MIAGALVTGHVLLSDWLLLIAAVLFVADVAAIVSTRPSMTRGILPGIALALVSVALLVV